MRLVKEIWGLEFEEGGKGSVDDVEIVGSERN